MNDSMVSNGEFDNFDDKAVYTASLEKAKDPNARNFVVQFGKGEAQVAFDLNLANFETLLDEPFSKERPVRWINIWAPDRQVDIVKLLGQKYEFSPRLLAIMRTEPPEADAEPEEKISRLTGRKVPMKADDVELGAVVIDDEGHKGKSESGAVQSEISHYTLAEQMINYQSIDFGTRYLCIGANWMHGSSRKSVDEFSAEGEQRRLWSWLVLCNDHTVISLHENPGFVNNEKDIKSIRKNTLSVLSQLSDLGHVSADPISMQTVRQALKQHDIEESYQGVEGASLLFYYLFDDWRAVFITVGMYKQKLGDLRKMILGDAGKRSITTPRAEIIPRLHVLGYQLRQSQHLYEGYKNLIERALREAEPKLSTAHGSSTPRSMSIVGMPQAVHRGVVLSNSATKRFERLGDRLDLLILNKTKEFLAEKDALISTYFNINAQKDSEATARLTRSTTLLAKLSVLFLPVSLMTSYFSVQISELAGVYTARDYWTAFAVLMSISFMFLFFFSRLLMWVTETLDAKVKKSYIATSRYFGKNFGRRKSEARKR